MENDLGLIGGESAKAAQKPPIDEKLVGLLVSMESTLTKLNWERQEQKRKEKLKPKVGWQVVAGGGVLAVSLLAVLFAMDGVRKEVEGLRKLPVMASIDTGETKLDFKKMQDAIAFAAGNGALQVNQHTDSKVDEILQKLASLDALVHRVSRNTAPKAKKKPKKHHRQSILR
jgi:hypothetical protein